MSRGLNTINGLLNIGNTCYLNSGLQMLIQNRDFCNIILQNRDKSENTKVMANFIQEYYSSNDNSINPAKVKSIVEKKRKMFRGSQQHDAAEFIVTLLEILNEDLNDEINKLFNIEIKSSIKCKLLKCLTVSETLSKSPFLILSINQDSKNLDDCYRNYKVHEKLEKDDLYFCEKCQEKRIASKKISINNWSNHLIIWLKRFEIKNGNSIKINNSIEIPLEWRHEFKIVGAVLHSGGTDGGHYMYISRNLNSNSWTLCNDSSVNELSENQAQQYLNKAYILYYRKFLIYK